MDGQFLCAIRLVIKVRCPLDDDARITIGHLQTAIARAANGQFARRNKIAEDSSMQLDLALD